MKSFNNYSVLKILRYIYKKIYILCPKNILCPKFINEDKY